MKRVLLLCILLVVGIGGCGGTGSSTAAQTLFTVGGTITGLAGTVVLQNNAANDLTITESGTFTFTTEVADGAAYAVTVSSQPDGLTCSVSNGTGTVAGAKITDISIVCSDTTYTVGGTITGLSGTVVLQNSAADDLTVTESGNFTFSTAVADGAGYEVTVKTQPSGLTCSVSSGQGTLSGANVTNVTIVCAAATYTVGGTLAGLSGTVVLQNNSGNDLTLTANGAFTFTTALADGASYTIAVSTQPDDASCSVATGTGTVSGANVTTVTVTCAADTYTVGGTISGLSGTVVLRNNGGNDLSNTTNGAYSFSTAIATGVAYAVTVLTQPSGQTCTVSNGSGTISAANITNVTVSCVDTPCTICTVFVSSTTSSGNFGGLSGADASCNTLAGNAGLDGTFVAWLSSSTIDAKDRIVDAEYRLVNGTTVVANDLADLIDGSLDNKIDMNENGVGSLNNNVWTGTESDGTEDSAANTCSGWTNGDGDPNRGQMGASNQTGGNWTVNGNAFCSASSLSFYCFQVEE